MLKGKLHLSYKKKKKKQRQKQKNKKQKNKLPTIVYNVQYKSNSKNA